MVDTRRLVMSKGIKGFHFKNFCKFAKCLNTTHADREIDHSSWNSCIVGEFAKFINADATSSCAIGSMLYDKRSGFPRKVVDAMNEQGGFRRSGGPDLSTYGNMHRYLKRVKKKMKAGGTW